MQNAIGASNMAIFKPVNVCCNDHDLNDQDKFHEPLWCCCECGTWHNSNTVIKIDNDGTETLLENEVI